MEINSVSEVENIELSYNWPTYCETQSSGDILFFYKSSHRLAKKPLEKTFTDEIQLIFCQRNRNKKGHIRKKKKFSQVWPNLDFYYCGVKFRAFKAFHVEKKRIGLSLKKNLVYVRQIIISKLGVLRKFYINFRAFARKQKLDK